MNFGGTRLTPKSGDCHVDVSGGDEEGMRKEEGRWGKV